MLHRVDRGHWLVLFLRARFLPIILAGISTMWLVQILVGLAELSLPIGQVHIPYRSLIPLIMACLVCLVLESQMGDWEECSARRSELFSYMVFVLLAVATFGLEIAVGFFAGDISSGFVFARSLLIWAGLGVFGSMLLSPRAGWMFPAATILPLTYFESGTPDHTDWWNFPAQSWDSVTTWLLLAAAIGLAMIVGVARFAFAGCASGEGSLGSREM